MRNAVRPILLGAALALACAAAHAQPAAARPRKQPDARCRDIASRYIHPSPDKPHLTVEQEEWYEYEQTKKYLALCGDSDDDFTRGIKQSVANHEAAAQCDATWPQYERRLGGRFDMHGDLTPEQQREAYEVAKEFLKACGRWNTERTGFVRLWVEKYDRDAREREAAKSLPSLFAAARSDGAGPETYARLAEAYVLARYGPAERAYYHQSTAVHAPPGAGLRAAEAKLDAARDLVVDAYARALAACGGRAECGGPRAEWRRRLSYYYALGHGSSGLEERIAHALEAPLPEP